MSGTHDNPSALDLARRLLGGALSQPPEALPDDASLMTTPAWDSLAHVRIVMAVEEHRGCALTPEQVLALRSLHAIAEVLRPPG